MALLNDLDVALGQLLSPTVDKCEWKLIQEAKFVF
jgi:hypothetical protein